MKKTTKQAAKYESKKSLDGAMKFLKGNVSKDKKPKK
jgi:type III secretory pathway component EscV